MSIKFFDPDSNNNSSSITDPKSDIDIENTIPLCDSCKNVILKPYKDHNKLICPQCLTVYDPKYEYIQIQDQETTLDDLSAKGEMTFINEDKKIRQKTTLNRQNSNLENTDYIKKEFDRYRQTEIIQDKPVRKLNRQKR